MKKRNYNKIFAMLLVVLTLVGAFVCPQVFQSSETSKADAAVMSATLVEITADGVNVRVGPAIGYQAIGTVSKNSAYKYLDSSVSVGYTWYKIQYTSSQYGWVRGDYATKITVSSTPYCTTTKSDVYGRSGPDEAYGEIFYIAGKGTRYSCIASSANGSNIWYKLVSTNGSAYIVFWVSGECCSYSG